MTTVRDYVPADERAWLHCRVLSQEFGRVHVCRRFVRRLDQPAH